mgnify:CR=1 FL=1
MTSLNSKLQLALLNRKKGRNLLEKGFTLVELMIVIVIVGVLSSVALPNFLNQTSKAKATECSTKAGALMGEVASEALSDNGNAFTLFTTTGTGTLAKATADSALCTFSTNLTTAPTNGIYTMQTVGKGDLADKYGAKLCINYENGKRKVTTTTTRNTAGMTALTAPVCT